MMSAFRPEADIALLISNVRKSQRTMGTSLFFTTGV